MEDEELKLKNDRKLPMSVVLRRNMKYLKPELPRFILAFILMFFNVGIDLLMPSLISNITDSLSNNIIEIKHILIIVVLYFVLCIVNQGILYIESMLLQKTGQKIIYNIRNEVFEHIEMMSQNQFNEMPVGSLVTRVASYTASMSDLFTSVFVNVLRNIITIIGVYAIMFFYSWKLSLFLFIFVALVFGLSFGFSKVSAVVFRNERKYISDLNTFMNENLSGMKLTQIFNQEARKLSEFDVKNENLRKAKMGVTYAFAIYRPLITFIYYLAIASTFAFGLKLNLSGGEILAFYLYLSKFFNPIQNLADQLNNIQKASTASERLINLLDIAPEVLDKDDALDYHDFKGKIEFKNVWFAYKKDEWILKDVSFVINPKQTCAFVGATGAGKTTILSLIVRNYEIQKGQILIDDIDISKIKIENLRRGIGQMLQDVFLFTGTIKSNITLRDDRFTDEEIKAACDYVNASSFINKLPNGLNEEVIERGENFSQGERQLLSFARTVLHKPQILILDEATANIDTETEVVIQKSLEKIKNIGTMLVVAHRLSTIQHADQIIVLQHGEIIERGNHQSLLKQKGYYYKLYKLQFENQ